MDRALRAAWPAAALLAVALGGATAAQAEVVRAVTLSSGSILPVVHPVSLDGAVGFQSFLLPTGGAGEATAWPSNAAGGDTAPESASAPRELPAAPGSGQLALYALGSLGAFQTGRSLRRLGATMLPEWYATNGPHQVGHATAFDPTVDFARVAVVCPFVVVPQPARQGVVAADSCVPVSLPDVRRSAAPRAPPARSALA